MDCPFPSHRGGRRIFKSRILYLNDGTRVEGCMACTDGYTHDQYPADKRWIVSQGTGHQYKMSAAHRRDIRMRRVAPDLSHVWKDRRGHGSGVNLTQSREYNPATTPTGPKSHVDLPGVRDRG